MKKIAVDDAPKAIGPYSQGIDSGSFVFVSGQIPIDPVTGKITEGDIGEQTIRVLKNVEAVLKGVGLSRKSIVKVTVFMDNLADYIAMNETYAEFFGETHPARSAVEVSNLPRNAKVEIDAIAEK